jgi:hypothetical protein
MSDTVMVAIVAAVPACLAAIMSVFNRAKISEVHGLVNARLTQVMADLAEAREELRKLTATSSFAEGQKQEKGTEAP